VKKGEGIIYKPLISKDKHPEPSLVVAYSKLTLKNVSKREITT
jgi:hypothetical protein